MVKPKLFVINLSGNNSVYFAGSNVEGSVSLELLEAKKTQGISIRFTGRAYVHWTERGHSTGPGGDQNRTYSDTQIIFNDMFIQLWGNGKDSHDLAPGRYEFPFKFQFPWNSVLPTSYESHTGYIRYSLLARIKRSWKFDLITTRAITVNEVIDINTSRLRTPLVSSNEKMLFNLCCASGPISLSVKTDRGGYCPGESIAISIEAENHSNRRITRVQAFLEQIVVYYAKGHSRVNSTTIQRIEGPGIAPNASSNWNNKLLPIPATVPSINSCHILKLSYILTVKLSIPHSSGFRVLIPITIGNVPFQGGESATVGTSAYPPPSRNMPSTPYSPQTTNPYPPVSTPGGGFNYSAAHAPVNIGLDSYTMGATQYAPVYGFVNDYRFAPPPSYSEATVK